MAIFVARAGARYSNTTVNRTIQSGGSVGGDKKAGTVYISGSWPLGNWNNFMSRSNKQSEPPLSFILTNTTRRPVQNFGGKMVSVHGLSGLG